MATARLEAFSDGVLAIIITIMVLEMKVPHGVDWEALHPTISGLFDIHDELYPLGHLLEQSSSHAARY